MPHHLDIRVSGGRIAIGSQLDFAGLANVTGNAALRREGLRELRRHGEVLDALRRWPRLGEVFGGSTVNSDAALFRRVEDAVSRRHAVVLFVSNTPPLARFDLAEEHGRFRTIAAPARQAVSAPVDPIAAMTPRARVVLALTESRRHMAGELAAYMQAMITQGALPTLGFYLFALAAANVANPIVGGLMDGAIMAFVAITVGSDGVRGLQKLAGAIGDAAGARDRAGIDAGAKVFAEALAAVGGTVFLGWLLHRVGKVTGGGKSGGAGSDMAAAVEESAAKYVDPRTVPSARKILEPDLSPKAIADAAESRATGLLEQAEAAARDKGAALADTAQAAAKDKLGVADGVYSRIVEGGGLKAFENAGGHLLEKHVGKTEQELLNRLAQQPTIKAASSFLDRAGAERAVSEAIDANSGKVAQWMTEKGSKLVIDHTSDVQSGISAIKGAAEAAEVNSTRVILVKDQAMATGYKILTGFPTKP